MQWFVSRHQKQHENYSGASSTSFKMRRTHPDGMNLIETLSSRASYQPSTPSRKWGTDFPVRVSPETKFSFRIGFGRRHGFRQWHSCHTVAANRRCCLVPERHGWLPKGTCLISDPTKISATSLITSLSIIHVSVFGD
jgi:hypothetical protein